MQLLRNCRRNWKGARVGKYEIYSAAQAPTHIAGLSAAIIRLSSAGHGTPILSGEPGSSRMHPHSSVHRRASVQAPMVHLSKCEGMLRSNSTHLWNSQRQLKCHEAGQPVGEAGVGVKQTDQLQRAGSQHGGIGLQQLLQGGRCCLLGRDRC